MSDATLIHDSRPHELFGEVQFFQQGPPPDKSIAKKLIKFGTESEFQATRERLETRSRVDHPNLARLWVEGVEPQSLSLTVCVEFNERNDLNHRPVNTKNDSFGLFLVQTIRGLAYLEKNQLFHGNLRPVAIFFDEASNLFKICDPLTPQLDPLGVQADNLARKRDLWTPYGVFDNLRTGEQINIFNPYKQDVYALGLICLSFWISTDTLQGVYAAQEDTIDSIATSVLEKVSDDKKLSVLLQFVVQNLLAKSPSRRFSPQKAQLELEALMAMDFLGEENFLTPTIASEVDDVPYLHPLPDETVQILKAHENDPNVDGNREFDSLLPINKAFPKNEIDFAKTSKVFRPIKKERAGKPVPRWEIMFVNADMSYKGLGASGIVSVSREPLNRSGASTQNFVDQSKSPRPVIKPARISFKSSNDSTVDDATKSLILQKPQAKVMTVQSRPAIIESAPPEILRPRVAKVETTKPVKLPSRKNIPSFQSTVGSNAFDSINAPRRDSKRDIKYLSKSGSQLNKTSGNIVEVSFHKVEVGSNVTTDLGKGIPVGDKKLEYVSTTPNGRQVFRYAKE
jgi:serine/threonine protein kinase